MRGIAAPPQGWPQSRGHQEPQQRTPAGVSQCATHTQAGPASAGVGRGCPSVPHAGTRSGGGRRRPGPGFPSLGAARAARVRGVRGACGRRVDGVWEGVWGGVRTACRGGRMARPCHGRCGPRAPSMRGGGSSPRAVCPGCADAPVSQPGPRPLRCPPAAHRSPPASTPSLNWGSGSWTQMCSGLWGTQAARKGGRRLPLASTTCPRCPDASPQGAWTPHRLWPHGGASRKQRWPGAGAGSSVKALGRCHR